MSILSVDTISPIGSGTTVTLNATETKVNNFITVGTGASISSPSSNVLTLGTNNTEGLRLLSNGNVLIGTTIDGNQALNVYGAANAALVIQNSSTGTGASNGLYIGNGSQNIAYFWNYENDQIRVATNNIERIRITNTGKIGIGAVIEPTVAFEVRGTDASHYLRVENTNSSSAFTALSLKTTGVDFQIWNQGPAGGSYAGTNGVAFYQALISGSYGPYTFYHGTTRRMSVDTDGDVTITDGNLNLASGHGIDFSSYDPTSYGSISSEILDDYEEGSWTPTEVSGLSLTVYVANYIKIGRLVHVECGILIPTNSDGGGLQFDGLPYQAVNSGDNSGGLHLTSTNSNRNDTFYAIRNQTKIGVANLLNQNVARSAYSNKQLKFSGTYMSTF